MKKSDNEFVTIEKVYNNLALFVFGILSYFLFIILISNQNLGDPNLRVYTSLGFFSLSIIIIFYLLGDFGAYYGLKTYDWFRKNWSTYKWYYWTILLIITLAFLIVIGYLKLDNQTFWGIIIGMFGAAILTALGWIFVNKFKT